ncbi:hypothetical protein ACQP00_20570 [Dactylosporangium sp. CS-047395]|uniref:hypothetical protein n=1 Tax=Dactylosporangium sp. CS-047395 TaxID=3239936 RepID=UPI003D8A4F2D
MSMDHAVRLGIEVGADYAIAALAWPDGTAMVLPMDGSGFLIAPEQARSRPASGEPEPVDTSNGPAASPRLPPGNWTFAAVTRILQDAHAVAGTRIDTATVAIPAGWSLRQREQVRANAVRAGLRSVQLMPSPIAVCWHVLAGGHELPPGAQVVVCEVGDSSSAAVVGRDGDGGFTVVSDVDELTVRSGIPGNAPSGPPVEEVVRRAMAGADLPIGTPDLVCAAGHGARRADVGRSLHTVTGVEPMLVVEAELAAVLGAVQGPQAVDHGAPAPHAAAWHDVWALLLPALWSMALFAQFLTGSQRYGPREKLGQPGMLLAAWGGLAFAALFALLAVVSTTMLATAARHEPTGRDPDSPTLGEWVRHRLTAAALAGGAAGGVLVAGLFVVIAGGFFDLELGPLLRWSVLPILPAAAAVVAVAVVVWRRPEPPEGEWPQWLRFPPVAVMLAGIGTLLISYDETGSPWVLQPLSWQLQQWLPPGQMTIIGPVGRLGGLCIGAATAWLLVTRPLARLLLGTFLALLVASVLSWRITGAVAVGFCLVAAVWWAFVAVRLVLRPKLLASPAPGARPAATAGDGAGR